MDTGNKGAQGPGQDSGLKVLLSSAPRPQGQETSRASSLFCTLALVRRTMESLEQVQALELQLQVRGHLSLPGLPEPRGRGRPAPPGQKSQAKGCSPSPEMATPQQAQQWRLDRP